MKYHIVHRTEYVYEKPVSQCYNEARLAPRDLTHQHCASTQLAVSPLPSDYRERDDFFGNRVAHFTVHQAHQNLIVTASSDVEIETDGNHFDGAAELSWQQLTERLQTDKDPQHLLARQFLLDSPLVTATAALAEYGQSSFSPDRPVLEAVHDLMERIHRDFVYDPGFTTLSTPLGEVMKHRRGVCQDFAHVAIGCLRTQGVPARYISGYLETLPPPGTERLVGADASHAWFSIYLPDTGWLDFDPTNNQMPMDRHITVAWGRDYSDVSPLKGVVFGGGEHEVKVAVDVRNLETEPL